MVSGKGAPLAQLVAEIVGDGPLRTFDLIGIAEEEIAAKGDLPGLFKLLAPPGNMAAAIDDVYRAHARELVARAHRGADLELATDAELLLAFWDASLRAPLNSLGSAAYMELADRVLTSEWARAALAGLPEAPREPYEGAIAELLSDARRRFRVLGRGLSEPRRVGVTLADFAEGRA